MPSIGMQMPQLYLRGSLCNQTMVNLDEEQVHQLSEIVDSVIDDPLLQPARYQFKNALRFTIKGDYEIAESADQEYQIAIWKAAAAAKFGWGKHDPSEEAITDPVQRKKFFQTWVFNYLRQILNENKRPQRKTTKFVQMSPVDVCKNELMELLSDQCRVIKEAFKECEIFCNLFLLPSQTIDDLSALKDKYFTKGIQVNTADDQITIKNINGTEFEMIEVETKTLISTVSASSGDDKEDGGLPELEAVNTSDFDDPDTIEFFIDNLSENAQKVIQIIMNPPEAYIEAHGEKPVKKYIAEYLDLNAKQVKEIWGELRMVYCDIIGIPETD